MANLRKPVYVAHAAQTITLASLATSSTWLVGREMTAYDNSSNLYHDVWFTGLITTGTTPTAGTNIQIWAVPELTDSTWPMNFTGTDAGITLAPADINVLSSCGQLVALMVVTATSNVGYNFVTRTMRDAFGIMPRKVTLYLTHNTAMNLNSTGGNHHINAHATYENLNA